MALPNSNLGDTVNIADVCFAPRVAPMEPTMLNGIYGFDVLRATTTRSVASMVDMLRCRTRKRFEHEAVNLAQPLPNPDVPVSFRASVSPPYPAIANYRDAVIEPQKIGMVEHLGSIHFAGFSASAPTPEPHHDQ